ncbi:MAG: hypothetical protein Q8R37_01565 [Nanoarchaeota archaeon]|nr:hypothetical protein [Nanoarchaeota archaeon]
MDTKYGIISDIHQAHPRLVDVAIKVLIQEGAQKLVLNGDLVGDKFPDPQLDEQNYAALVLQLAGKSGLETYVNEGSHECLPLFIPVMKTLSSHYGNLIDAMTQPKIEWQDHDLVFLPGSDWHGGNAFEHGGYFLHTTDGGTSSKPKERYAVVNMNTLRNLATNPETTIVFSHIPRKFDRLETGVDMAYFAQHIVNGSILPGVVKEKEIRQKHGDIPFSAVEEIAAQGLYRFKRENRGNEDLRKLYQELGITKNMTGHFHESAHRAHDSNAVPVAEGEYTSQLFWNASYLDDGKVGILSVRENTAAYRNIDLHNSLR